MNGDAPVHLCDEFRMGVSCLVLAFSPTSATIRVTNNQADETQVRDVFFTVYERNLPDTFETQTKYAAGSAQVIGLKPRQSAVLTATLPSCFAQLDVYIGPEVNTPPHAPYKLLGAEHAGGPAFCNASSPASPAPTPTSGSGTPSPTSGPAVPSPAPTPAPGPAAVCEAAAPVLSVTSTATPTTIAVKATPSWKGTAGATIAWGDTTSSTLSTPGPVGHTYPRPSADTTYSVALTVNAGGVMCSTQASVSVPKAAAVCPAGKAAVLSPTITIEGSMARVTFSLAEGCSGVEVSLATYMAPSVAIAYPQYLYASDHPMTVAPQKFNAGGPYTLTAPLPACFWQADLALGQVIETLTVDHLYGSRTIVFKNGGSTTCPSR